MKFWIRPGDIGPYTWFCGIRLWIAELLWRVTPGCWCSLFNWAWFGGDFEPLSEGLYFRSDCEQDCRREGFCYCGKYELDEHGDLRRRKVL